MTTHAPALARALGEVSGRAPIELALREGATVVVGQGLIWNAEPDEPE